MDVAFDSTSTATFDVTCAAFPGDLVVITGTTGQNQDPDGYSVAVDGSAGTAIEINASITIPNLAAGDHQVLLDGVANNCTVTQPNPRTVTIPDGGVDSTTFAVDCSKRVGDLVVKTSTSGTDPDNTYTVLLDGGSGQSITGTDSVLFASVAEGSHTVTLTGVNANCTVSGGASKTVSVTYKQTTTTSFTVSCVADVGTIHASASTSGSDQDSDGYTLALDGSTPASITSPTGSHDFTGVPVGSHTVTLGGVNANCSITSAGGATQTVEVTFGTAVNAAFTVSCSPNQGSIQASNTTTGTDLDADGYSVTLDGGGAQTMATDASTTFSNVAVGTHSVAIASASVAPNCTVTSANPTSVSVTFGNTASASFTISCVSSTGTVKATTSTTGSDLPSGYTVDLDGSNAQSIGINNSTGITFSNVPTGSHTVNLVGVPANCSVTSTGGTAQPVTVSYNTTVTAAFTVSCQASTGTVKATTSTTGSDLPSGYTVDLDGSNAQSIGINNSTGVTFSNVPTGSHTVNLVGVPANCSVTSTGGTAQPVTVSYNTTVTAAFTVSCQASTGTVKATTSTTGSDLPSGYTVDLDGSNAQSIGINNSTGVTFSNVPTGSHTVNLVGVPANCSVTSTGGTAQPVTVSYNTTVTAAFTVSCQASTGTVKATTSTTGSDLPSGYTVDLDGSNAQSIGINNSTGVTFSNVPTGSHTVNLVGVPANCSVTSTGGTAQPVTVSYNTTVTAAFTVSCQANVGSIQASNSTTGTDLDPDGYSVTVDGGSAQTMATNASTTFNNVAVGSSRSVAIDPTSVQANCTVSSSNPTSVTVAYDSTSTVSFTISCVANVGSIQATATSSGASAPTSYTVQLDGGTAQTIGANGGYTFPSVSVGSHQVTLNVPSPTCTVTTTNPLSVNVTFGNQASAPFTVSCP